MDNIKLMKKLIISILGIIAVINVMAQNDVYGKYIKAIDSLDAANISIRESTISTSGANTLLLQTANNSSSDIDLQTTNVNSSIRFLNNSGGVEFEYTNAGDGLFDFQQGTLSDIGSLTVDNLTLNGNTINAITGDLILSSTSGIIDADTKIVGGVSTLRIEEGADGAAASLFASPTSYTLASITGYDFNLTVGGTQALGVDESTNDFDFQDNSLTNIGSLTADQLTLNDSSISTTSDVIIFDDSVSVNNITDVLKINNDASVPLAFSSDTTITINADSTIFETGDVVINDALYGVSSASGSFYEEGSWTPEYTPGTGSFTSISYTTQQGKYVRIGNLVWVYCQIASNTISIGSASGIVEISGLPFTSKTGTKATGAIGQVSTWAGEDPMTAIIQGNSTLIELWYRSTSDSPDAQSQVADMVTSSGTRNVANLSIVYQTDL